MRAQLYVEAMMGRGHGGPGSLNACDGASTKGWTLSAFFQTEKLGSVFANEAKKSKYTYVRSRAQDPAHPLVLLQLRVSLAKGELQGIKESWSSSSQQ